MAGESSSSEVIPRELDQTATWAVAGVCAVIILISLALEKILHKVGGWLGERHKKSLFEALEKVKAELMILGFISLSLVFSQYYIAAICIPIRVANVMLPCALRDENRPPEEEQEHRRRLLSYERRVLAAAPKGCRKGTTPLITVDALHDIHILIFFLAVLHVLYSMITMGLGKLKTRRWKQWEQETTSHDYEFSHDPSRFRLAHETSFVRAHTSFWTRIPVFFYIGCFFQQFYKSVTKSDYLTLRNGFINVHLAPGTRFDFQKYIKRSLEDDFKVVVGVSPILWASFVLFLLLNVNGWRTLFWASLIPVVIILAVGTKLQAILSRMALDITDRHAVVQGMPLVQGSDQYFWFGRPKLVLLLIQFALFQNAFQLTYFLWIWYSYGLNSCLHESFGILISKICLAVAVLFLCSYITLPLYALVAQVFWLIIMNLGFVLVSLNAGGFRILPLGMGSNMKKSIFDEQTSNAIKKWHMAVKKKHHAGQSPSRTLGVSMSPTSSGSSPFNSTGLALQRYKTTGHSTRSYGYEDTDIPDLEDPSGPPAVTASLIVRSGPDDIIMHDDGHESGNEEQRDFSFVKPVPQ